MRDAFLKRRDFVIGELKKINGIKINQPQGAFYVFPDVSFFFNKSYNNNSINNANDLSLYLLETAKVALVTGNAFGSPNCMRISYAASIENLKEAMSRITISLNKLN